MKRQFSFLWVVFALLAACPAAFPACSPSIEPAPTQTPRSALVKVECYNAPVQEIVHLLRSARAKDITVAADGSFITAAFSPTDTPPGRLEQIIHDLNNVSGVLHVEVAENPHPIMQNF